MRSFLVIAFVAAVAALALYVARRPTIAKGSVIAADLLAQNRARGWRDVACQDEIPIGVDGAKFECRIALTDGDVARVAMTLDREGNYMLKAISQTAPEHRHVPASADPWD